MNNCVPYSDRRHISHNLYTNLIPLFYFDEPVIAFIVLQTSNINIIVCVVKRNMSDCFYCIVQFIYLEPNLSHSQDV